MSECDSPESKLAEAFAECERLREENRLLRGRLKLTTRESATPPPAEPAPVGLVTAKSSPKEKVALFRSLFRGREDVHAVRWEGRQGKAGYSPASRRVWGGPNPPDSESLREYLPLTDQVLHDHLTGRITAGVYPMLTDETCWFLAADFDKATWQEDVRAYLDTCSEWHVPALLERSRSGRGGHVWIFFAAPLPARLARKLGAAILTRTMEHRHHLGLDSYDRFFPSQDTKPKGGFGNLIALPLQAVPRGHGNSVFLDAEFKPYTDQWSLLSGVRRMGLGEVESLVAEAERKGDLIGVRHSVTDEDGTEDPWTLPPSRKKKVEAISGPLPAQVRIVRANLIFVETAGLPSAMLNRLHRLAAFQNPEFYRAQAMRLSTFDKPRVIRCAEEFPKHLALPRGCLGEITSLFQSHEVAVAIEDQRFAGLPLNVTFHGTLRADQQAAANDLLAHRRASGEHSGARASPTTPGPVAGAARVIPESSPQEHRANWGRTTLPQWDPGCRGHPESQPEAGRGRSGGQLRPCHRRRVPPSFGREFRAGAPAGEGASCDRPHRHPATQGRSSPDHCHAVRADPAPRERQGAGLGAAVCPQCPAATDPFSNVAVGAETRDARGV